MRSQAHHPLARFTVEIFDEIPPLECRQDGEQFLITQAEFSGDRVRVHAWPVSTGTLRTERIEELRHEENRRLLTSVASGGR